MCLLQQLTIGTIYLNPYDFSSVQIFGLYLLLNVGKIVG
jgi:hypothetical protein